MASPVELYLQRLRTELRHDPLLARRLCAEVADHLAEIAANERRQGMSDHEAEEVAVNRFGAPGPLARQFDPFSFPLLALLACGALATGAIALWLVGVIALVLPARDPARLPLWTGIAIAFALYAALSLAYVLRGPRPAVLVPAVVTASLAAIAFGSYLVQRMLAATGPGAHFEGYLLLMGVVLAGHGLCALAYVTLNSVITHRIRAH